MQATDWPRDAVADQ